MKVVAITQARCGSSRLPSKVLKQVAGQTLLEIHINRIKKSKLIDELVVATTTNPEDSQIVEIADSCDVKSFAGSQDDVLDRYYKAALQSGADLIVRLTSDCPLIDAELIDQVIEKAKNTGADYAANTFVENYPDGQDVEIFTMASLTEAWERSSLLSEREHVSPYIRKNTDLGIGESNKFKAASVVGEVDFNDVRLTVDEPADLEVIRILINDLGVDRSWKEYAEYYQKNERINKLNGNIVRNEGYMKSLKQDLSKRYEQSEKLLERAKEAIPLGSQTFSKSHIQFPFGASPYFVDRAEGSKVWDVDGNEYIDFSSALGGITLGHCYPEVNRQVEEQMKKGTIFSLGHQLEIEVAELICKMVPSAEMVRFGKNGSDATAGAIRVARAYTNREHVLVCGYHGWQDWYIGSTARNLGVPKATQNLTHTFQYNNLDSLVNLFASHKGQVAAVIMEPMNVFFPENNFLEEVKRLTHENGALLIFDEIITGFRLSNGGAQELFGVTPDLTTLGKGLANGFPLSAVAGKKEVMELFSEIFYSFTYGGETLSLAAAKATMEELQGKPVMTHLTQLGKAIKKRLSEKIDENNFNDFLKFSGHTNWSFMIINDSDFATSFEIRTLFIQEMFRSGIISIGSHNLTYSHSMEDIDHLMEGYDQFFQKLSKVRDGEGLTNMLNCDVLEPLFRVR